MNKFNLLPMKDNSLHPKKYAQIHMVDVKANSEGHTIFEMGKSKQQRARYPNF